MRAVTAENEKNWGELISSFGEGRVTKEKTAVSDVVESGKSFLLEQELSESEKQHEEVQ